MLKRLFTKMKIPILVCTLSIVVCVTANAQLKWEQTILDLHPALGDKDAVGHFKYENVGKTPIHFKMVKPSCGCTTAQTQKDVVQPGEKGEITATFNIGERTGMQVKNVTVQTDDPDPARALTTLTLKTMIPQLLEIQPTLVYWQGGEKPNPKSIAVKASQGQQVKSINVTAANQEFQTKVTQAGEGQFSIEVTPPANVEKATGTTITIQPENSPKTFTATAMVAGGPPPTPIKK
jgi:hypothetical protein